MKDGANGISVNSLTLSLNAVLPKFICESRMYAGKARQTVYSLNLEIF